MKILLYGTAIVLLSTYAGNALASDVYISNDNRSSYVSGQIQTIEDDEIEILVNGKVVEVDTDELDIEEAQRELLNIGDEVRFTGMFDGDEFEAKSLILLEPANSINLVDQ